MVGAGHARPSYRPLHTDSTGDAVQAADDSSVRTAELRELHYSAEGDFDQVVGDVDAWKVLSELRGIDHLSEEEASNPAIDGKSTLVVASAWATRANTPRDGLAGAASGQLTPFGAWRIQSRNTTRRNLRLPRRRSTSTSDGTRESC